MTTFDKKPVWKCADPDTTNISKFKDFVNKKHKLNLRTYEDLHRWSTQDTFVDFWRDAFIWLKLAPGGSGEVGPALEKGASTTQLYPPPRFFPHDRLNIAEYILRDGRDDAVAIHFAREGAPGIERITWRELRDRTRKLRDAMINSGIKSGDVVAAVISNSVYAVTICLAALSIGATWSSSSPDLGAEGIVDRYGQISPKLIFADDGYVYAGKLIKLQDRISEWSQSLASSCKELKNVVLLPYCSQEVDMSKVQRGCTLQSFLDRGSGSPLDFTFVPFSHPAFILYSSGTTGKPKCIVHSAGGVALKVGVDMVLQNDVRKDDVVFQYTTTSWVMWVLNFMNLVNGSSMLLYDGSPYHPAPDVLMKLAQDVGVSVFGTSPRYLSDLRSRGIVPRKQFDLRKLRTVTSTGSVLPADMYTWFYNTAFPPQAHVVSMSGGTDISGSFVSGTPLLPLYAGEIQAKALGMAVDIFDAAQKDPVSVEQSGGQGELVCTRPFPSQPLYFHGAGGDAKYKSSYFDRFGTSVWCQGDFVQREKNTGGIFMLGRSDGVLNPSGVRFGSAEIYSVTETFPELVDSICVGQRREADSDERVLLFVKMKDQHPFTTDLESRIKNAIRATHSPRHVPRFISEVADIPYTVNGKKCEINVKQVVSGREAIKSGTMANPEALDLFRQFTDLPYDVERRKKPDSRL